MGMTEQQKVQTRKHLGYPNVSTVDTFVLGTPAGVQTFFIIEHAMDHLPVAAESQLQRYLDNLEAVEFQIFDDTETLVASKVGSIDLNPKEFEKVIERYDFIRNGLANLLGVYPNPYDKRFGTGGAGSINARVEHG